MYLCGRKACSSVSIDGLGALGSIRLARWYSTMSSSLSASNSASRRNGASRTAGKPAGSMRAMSQPEPLTQITSTSSPKRVRIVVFTEVLPPPWMTSFGSAPNSRLE